MRFGRLRHVQQLLRRRDATGVVYGNVLATFDRGFLTGLVGGFDHTGGDANFFSTLRIDAETGTGLLSHRVLRLWRFDDVCGAVGLLLGSDRKLTTVNHDVDVRFLTIVGAGVVANDDGAVWLNQQG